MKNILNNLSIKAKIIGNSLILLAMILGGSGYAWFAMNQIGNELEAIAEQDIPLTENLTKITENQMEQAIHFERAMRFGSLMNDDRSLVTKFNHGIDSFNEHGKKVNEEIAVGELMAEEAMAQAHSEYETKEFEHIGQALKAIEKEHVDFDKHVHEVFNLLKQGKLHTAEKLAEKVEREEDQLNEELTALLSEVEKFTREAGHRAEQHEQAAIKILSIITLCSLLLGGFISWIISSNIIKRLEQTSQGMKIIASGDLTHEIIVEGSDEICKLQQSMLSMQNRLLAMISQISATTFQLSSTAEQVSAIMQQTSNNIQQQQAETAQVSTAMNEMSIAVREVSKSVVGASAAANGANVETDNGQKIVQDAVNGIQQLATQIETTAEVISQVEQDSENINTVLDVIKGIAEQTNLLALNAAIEAARAGEQGRGFAVVADEVRTLAGRTQESTSEINQIIEKLQTGARNAVQAMTQSREQTGSVVEKTRLAGASLTTIAASVEQIDDMSSQIATATEQQNAVAENMNSNIKQISEMAVDNSASVQETSQAGNDLARLAVELQGLVEQFQVEPEAAQSVAD